MVLQVTLLEQRLFESIIIPPRICNRFLGHINNARDSANFFIIFSLPRMWGIDFDKQDFMHLKITEPNWSHPTLNDMKN